MSAASVDPARLSSTRKGGGPRLSTTPSARGPDVVEALARVTAESACSRKADTPRSASWQNAEKMDRGYLGRILLLTLLVPDIVQAILDEKHRQT
jgi:hypothetical protein